MQESRIVNRTALLVLVLAALTASTGCKNSVATDEAAVARQVAMLGEIPAPARLAIERETAGGIVSKVTPDEYQGRTVYTADFNTAELQPGEVQVTSDGRVLSRDVKLAVIPFADAPERVRAAAIAKTGGATPATVTRETRGSAEIYSFEIPLATIPHRLAFNQTGATVYEAIDINKLQLPPIVVSSLGSRFSGIVVTDIEEVRTGSAVTYRITGKHEKRDVRAVFLPNGSVQSVRARGKK